MSSFFSSLADKAQSALKDTPIAHHIPGASSGRPSTESQGEPAFGSRTLGHLTHQLRTFQQQYSSSTTPLQKVITTEKGVAIDFDNVARDTQAHSKELYLWGQTEAVDLKDTSDRLGWLNYVQGTLAQTLSNKLDAARSSWKELRAAEAKFAPRRTLRNNLEIQIKKLESENQRGKEQKIADIQAQIAQLDHESLGEVAELEVLKRKAFKESEQLKWQALTEYSEKMVLVTQAAAAILPVIPSIPPSRQQPYTGVDTTTNVRAALQKALDEYKPGSDRLILPQATPTDLKRSDTRSFGQTHAKELDSIGTTNLAQASTSATPPLTDAATPASVLSPSTQSRLSQSSVHSVQSHSTGSFPPDKFSSPTDRASSPPAEYKSPPLNPAVLNQAPAPIPSSPEDSIKSSPIVAPNPDEPTVKLPSVLPTVAETGVPKSAGPDGPGPASGSLLSIKSDHQAQRDSKDQLPDYGGSSSTVTPAEKAPQKWESADAEKKRLEREERERVLRGHSSGDPPPPPPGGEGGDEPPAYEF